ncbi:MAG: hypothetical protein HY923_10870 [Elusimicrobia bacterium]|nr:hypothetical protein [Elusimicrobiota bacterium]
MIRLVLAAVLAAVASPLAAAETMLPAALGDTASSICFFKSARALCRRPTTGPRRG